MWLETKSCGSGAKTAAVARGLLAAALFSASALQGVTLCLCATDPDDCGEHCHDCGSAAEAQTSHVDHVCEHLTIGALAPSEKVTTVTAKAAYVPLPESSAPWPQNGPRLTLRTKVYSRPPGVLFPQFTFISRSTQMLC